MNAQNPIQILLGLSAEDYAQIVYDFGIAFAAHYTMGNAWSVDYLIKSKSYWAWWRSQWSLRDERFLHEYEMYAGLEEESRLLDFYFEFNNPSAVESFPSACILDETYRAMLEDLNKEKGGVLC